MKNASLVFIFLFAFAGSACSQDTLVKDIIHKPQSFSLGGKSWGIGFGKSRATYSGIKFSFNDQTKKTNGISLSVYSNDDELHPITNGINFSFLFLNQYNVNGVAASVFVTSVNKKINGFFFGGLWSDVWEANGAGFSGLAQLSDTANGFFIAGIDITNLNDSGITISGMVNIADNVSNGIMLAGIYASADTCNGIIVGGIVSKTKKCAGVQLGMFNFTETMQGVQFGLLNTIKQNPDWCKTLPLVNFQFKKYVPRIDSISNGDTLLVKKYQLDNRRLKSEISYLRSDRDAHDRFGHWRKYDEKGRMTSDTLYSNDTAIATENITYLTPKLSEIELQNDIFSEHISVNKKDSVQTQIVSKGKTKWRYYDIYRKTYVYYDTLRSTWKNNVEVYAGNDLQLGTFILRKGDTVSDYVPMRAELFNNLPEEFMYDGVWLAKKDTALCLKKGKIVGYVYGAKDSSQLCSTAYFNAKRKKTRMIISANTDSCIVKTFYKNGSISSINVKDKETFFNKRGRITETFIIDNAYHYNMCLFHHNRLIEFRTNEHWVFYYKNGGMHKECSAGDPNDQSQRVYRKNGTLSKEQCFSESDNNTYLYDEKGALKKIKRNRHKAQVKKEYEGPMIQ